ncbi:MAG: hypothetical protein QW644_03015 [Candidatus Micrarchaeaceae archaeon]
MIDKERILRRLTDLERYSNVLMEIVPSSYAKYAASDMKTKAAVERYVQLISDIELEVMALLYKGLDFGIAGGEEPLANGLSNVLSAEVINSFRKRRALRDSLVHAYFDMHYDKETFGEASNLSDIAKFIKEVKKIIDKRS